MSTVRNRKRKALINTPAELTRAPKMVQLNNLQYDADVFKTMKTSSVVDEFWSSKTGVPKACNFILIGDPGVGKTTVALDIVCDLKRNAQKACFISAEMNKFDMYEYKERYPKFGEIDILFLGDYTDENPKLVIENILEKGYDIVLGDSFAEIIGEVEESCGMSSKSSEKWLIDLMCKHNGADNDNKVHTTFIMIQQMTKGGKFVGSNKLKHNTTGMLEIRFDGSSEMAPRYMEWSKNRRGTVGKKLYFSLEKQDHVNYHEDKWYIEENNRAIMEDELESLQKEADLFDELLASVNEPSTEAVEAE